MKNTIIYMIGLLSLSFLLSCEDFLDKAPGVDITQDTVFSSKDQLERFVAGTYRYGIHGILPANEPNYSGTPRADMSSAATDECEDAVSWPDYQGWNTGDVTPDNISTREDRRWGIRFTAIRRANIVLESIDKADNLDETYRNWVKGEMRFIRALNYFEMLKRYGGVPIVRESYDVTKDFNIRRNSVEDVVKFIVGDCDTAISLLPDVYTLDNKNMRGRVVKGAALMLKARTLLYAASPMFNTNLPYLDLGADNNLLCYGNFNVSRWQAAADAAKAAIDWAPAGNISLVTNQGVDKNYRYMSEIADNPEIILSNKRVGRRAYWESPWTHIFPQPLYYSSTWKQGVCMLFNHLSKYEKRDGNPQTWNPAGGDDLAQKIGELDWRFSQSAACLGSRWNNDYPSVNTEVGGGESGACITGVWMTRFIPQSITWSNAYATPNDVVFRLAEAYLNYAEALNEAQGPVAGVYSAVNVIRARSGQPDLPAGLTKDQMRSRIRNERAVEFFTEDHRFWDIRRWLIAEEEGVMQGNMWGFTITKKGAGSYSYAMKLVEKRTFTKKMYLHPFMRVEVLKGYLVQNPGY